MPRPDQACSRCVQHMTPGCTHLGDMYDRYFQKHPDDTEQDLVVYALNRMWALERDNKNKAQGNKASRIYKSRNTIASNMMEKKCPFTQGIKRCMRNAGHDGPHKF